MAESSVTLFPGRVTTVSTGMAAGTTIYNGDPGNAVWISANPTPGPGQGGIRVGPKGSVSWTTDGVAVYGSTDTGVTTAVTLVLSPNVGSLVNPIDVGVAVATQLAVQGVPNVLLGSLIFNGTVAGVTGKTFTGLDKYASLTVTVDSPNSAQLWQFLMQAGGITTNTFTIPQAITPGSSTPLTITLPIQGDTLSIYWSYLDAALNLTVYASNRPQPFQILSTSTQALSMNLTQAFTFGQKYDFPTILTGNGKTWQARMVVTGGFKGFLGFRGFSTDIDMFDSTGGFAGTDGQEIERDYIMPAGITRAYFGCRSAGTNTFTVVLNLFPGT